MANILFKRIEDSSLIDNYDIVDGSFIVTKDGKIFIDYGEERVPVIVKKKPAGIIEMYGGDTAPEGYLMCDGSAVSRTTYSDLFEAIGTAYGNGDGSTTFNLPNFKGRNAVGLDSNDTDFDTLGKTGGEKTHTLTVNEIPPHRHGPGAENFYIMRREGETYNYGQGSDTANTINRYSQYTGYAGGGQPHNIVQPYVVTNYIISY